MSLFDTGNWSNELAQRKLERMRLELAAQSLAGPIVGIEQMPDRALLAIVNTSNTTSPSPTLPT
jgi:hypothetical protein